MKPRLYSQPKHNQLLAALRTEDYKVLLPSLEPVRLKTGQIIFSEGDAIDSVLFVTMGVASVRAAEGSSEVELELVGAEGLVGLLLFIESQALYKVVMVNAGEAYALPRKHMNRHASPGTHMAKIVRLYTGLTVRLLAHGALCASFHTVEQRLAKWLLTMRDRVNDESFSITHELISITLGVRRASVTAAFHAFEKQGLISYSRGEVTIADHGGLETSACSCYRYTREQTDKFLLNLKSQDLQKHNSPFR
jgi:CRP-like cAMP-binding protein